MTNQNKMQWFIDAYNQGTLAYTLHNTNKTKGTIVIPTGGGKSGIVYEDMVYHILHRNDGEKLIFNLTAPILKLEAQLLNDFIAVIKEIFNDKIERGEFMFFMNSSADGDTYDVQYLNADVKIFNKEIDDFKNSKDANVAIIASCHKSLYKFVDKIDYMNSFATTFTYSDEAHLMVSDTKNNISYNHMSKKATNTFNELKKAFKCDYFYALTATPDEYITKALNEAARVNQADYHIIDVPARELIGDNKILPFMAFIQRVGNDNKEKITPEVCSQFMEHVKRDNPKIYHKMLITCHSAQHLEYLRDGLGKMGYVVYSTCSRDGGRFTEECAEFVDVDEVEFVNKVDNHDGDCFVLHIKQLTQGIDIKSLTDCIHYNSTHINDGVKRTIIQTIGRILRPLKGERGVDINHRKKPYGNVLFLVGDNEYDIVVNQMTSFLLKYYGRNGIKAFIKNVKKNYATMEKTKKFGSGSSGFGDDYVDYFQSIIDEFLIDMEEYIKGTILPRHKMLSKLNPQKSNKNLILMAIDSIKNKFAVCGGGHNTAEILTETEFMKAVNDLFLKYGIE